MPELSFKFRIPSQDDDRVEQRRSGRKPSRLGKYLRYSIPVTATVVLAVALEAYGSRHFGSLQQANEASRHELARMRESAGRRVPNPATWGRRTSGGPNCDCNVDQALFNGPYQRVCLQREQQLRELYIAGKLGLVVENGRLVKGEFCDGVTSGPKAWPVANGPALKPPGIPEGVACSPSGIARTCQ